MPYETQMIALSLGATALHGPLREVVFLEANKNSILVFADGTQLPVQHRSHGYDVRQEAYAFRVAAELGGTDPFSMLTFGYSGTGPRCYSVFLRTAEFKQTDVENIEAPLILRADGTKITGVRRRSKWSAEVTGKSLDEAKQRARQAAGNYAHIFTEEVLCDGAEAVKTVIVDSDSSVEARAKASREIPAGWDVLGVDVTPANVREHLRFAAFNETEAFAKATSLIKPSETTFKSLASVVCLRNPRNGLLGIGKRIGEYEVTFSIKKQQVTIRYRPQSRIRVTYGSSKLLCAACHQPMSKASDATRFVGGGPSSAPATINLRCERCAITRVEKRYEIDGEWIDWQDGSQTVL